MVRKELKDFEMSQVVGGTCYISQDYNQVAFQNVHEIYGINEGVSVYQVIAYADGLKGQYATEAEYDQAVADGLMAMGWVTVIGSW